MSGSVGFRYIGLIFAWSGMRTFFCPALQTVATQVPSMCMLVDQNFFSPDVENWIHCSFILPIYLSAFFFHLHFINTRIALIHLYHKSFLFECNPIKGEAKQQVLPLNAHLFFFPLPPIKNLFTHPLISLELMTCSCLFFSVCNARSYMIM